MYSDAYKRKLYWFEFDRASRRWSLGEMRFPTSNTNTNNQHHQNTNYFGGVASAAYHVTYHALNAPNSFDKQQQQFANDGYTYLAVASESVVFVSNNQSLIMCNLDNETCSDYFRPAATNFIQSQEGLHKKHKFYKNRKLEKNY